MVLTWGEDQKRREGKGEVPSSNSSSSSISIYIFESFKFAREIYQWNFVDTEIKDDEKRWR